MAKLTLLFFLSFLIFSSSIAFQSDELLVDDDEFGLEGAKPRSTDLYTSSSSSPQQQQQTPTIRRRYSDPTDLDSKVQFTLEHAFGDSDFSPAGTFSARLKTWSHGGKVSRFGLLILGFWIESFHVTSIILSFICKFWNWLALK